MARSDERSEDHEKPSSPTEIFLRSFQSAEAKPGEAADSAPMGEASWPADLRQDASSRPATRAESLPAEDSPGTSSGEFTRLFVRPTPSGEHERLTPLPSMVPPPTVAARAEKAWMPGGKDPASVSSGSPSFPPPSPATSTSASQFFSRDIAKTTAPPATRADTQDPGYGGIEQRPAWNAGASPEVSEVSELRRSLADEQYAYPKQTRSDRNHDIQWPADPFGGSPPQQSGHQPQNYGAASSPPASSVTVMLDRMALEEARAPFSNASSQTQPAAPPPERPAPYISPASGPGEYTRVINRIEMGPTSTPAAESQAPVQSSSPLAMPQAWPLPVIPPAMPVTAPIVAAAAPVRPEPPKLPALVAPSLAAPVLAAPVLAAPKSKLQEMLPLLLIANAFLMVVLIVIVIFALRAKT